MRIKKKKQRNERVRYDETIKLRWHSIIVSGNFRLALVILPTRIVKILSTAYSEKPLAH